VGFGGPAIGRSESLVVDLAAGTGNLARQLLRRADRVGAVDIDRRRLAALGRQLPGYPGVVARAAAHPELVAAPTVDLPLRGRARPAVRA